MRVLVTIIAPIYWSFAHQSGSTRNGFSLTSGVFRQESQVEFATGEEAGMCVLLRAKGGRQRSWCRSPCGSLVVREVPLGLGGRFGISWNRRPGTMIRVTSVACLSQQKRSVSHPES